MRTGSHLALALAASFLAPGASAQARDGGATRIEDDPRIERWRDHILPTSEEAAWERVPWIPSFAAGVRAADEQQRPLLLWVMNGHPLGCT